MNQAVSRRRSLFWRLIPAAALALAFPARPTLAQGTDDTRFALLPLPKQLRDGATVVRMDSTHHPVVVRQGSNGMVCMRVLPGEAAWDARCYEASMARLIFSAGELVMSGLAIDSLGPRIEAEVRAGKLTLPKQPAASYRALGPQDAYVPATGAVTARMKIWQSLHVPFATAEEMGLPDESTVTDPQRATMPVVVASGTWWSHVILAGPAGIAPPRGR